jgi:ATP-dependent Clp protease ATP-binding subunit ClpA
MQQASFMFERFTNRARHAVVLAQEEARRLHHNYIGTEHVLLGLLGEQGIASEALERFGITLEGAREEVLAMIGPGKGMVSGHIPFTPRAKKTLELALREALQLHHNFIGTEHILLGVIREGKGVGAQILQHHVHDLAEIRMAVLDLVGTTPVQGAEGRRWLRRRVAVARGDRPEWREGHVPGERAELNTTPAADKSLNEAARLAGSQPVGSHHLLLAALGDPNTAAARALAAHGMDLEVVRTALQNADITGTSDEQPEEAGRRQMLIRVTDQQLTVEVTDPVLVARGRTALLALGEMAQPSGTIRGDLPVSGSMSTVWQALNDSLAAIRRHAAAPRQSAGTDLGSSGGVGFHQGDSDQTGTEGN